MNKLLETIQKTLASEGMDCAFFTDEGEGSTPYLKVYLGNDGKHRERILEIVVDEQILPGHFADYERMKIASGLYRLQLQSTFPIEFQYQTAPNLASAINFINTMIELPLVILDEANDKIYYRNVQLLAQEEFNKTLLLGMIGMHRMILDVFSDLLEKIGSGKITYIEMLQEIEKYLQLMQKEQSGP